MFLHMAFERHRYWAAVVSRTGKLMTRDCEETVSACRPLLRVEARVYVTVPTPAPGMFPGWK
jgi:hypothetical protein